jgi:accessory colonization factor AcfC
MLTSLYIYVCVYSYIQLFQLRLIVHDQSGKSNTSAKGCWESL